MLRPPSHAGDGSLWRRLLVVMGALASVALAVGAIAVEREPAEVGVGEGGAIVPLERNVAGRSEVDRSTLRIVEGRVYDGRTAYRAHVVGGGGAGARYARGVFRRIHWDDGADVWYGCAFYLPRGFTERLQGEVDLMRWDNWEIDPAGADRSGIVVYGPPEAGRAYLIRANVSGDQEPLVGPFTIGEGAWHWIEVHQRFTADHSGDLSEAYLDGALVGQSTAVNWYGRPVTALRFGVVAVNDVAQANGLDVWFDRCTVSTQMVGPAVRP